MIAVQPTLEQITREIRDHEAAQPSADLETILRIGRLLLSAKTCCERTGVDFEYWVDEALSYKLTNAMRLMRVVQGIEGGPSESPSSSLQGDVSGTPAPMAGVAN